MANSLQSVASDGRAVTTLASLAGRYFVKSAARIWVAVNTTLKSLQTARMLSVLANMSDQQLAAIGITRSDIPQYAERLMSEEQSGGTGANTGATTKHNDFNERQD